MVNKIVIVALVAIIAVPILLGYGMNLQETTITEYKSDNNPVNVAQLLQTGSDYNYANGDTYILNTNFTLKKTSNPSAMAVYPYFESVGSVNTSLYLVQDKDDISSLNSAYDLWGYSYFSIDFVDGIPGNYVIMGINYLDSSDVSHYVTTVYAVVSLIYDDSTKTLEYYYLNSAGNVVKATYTENKIRLNFTTTSYTGNYIIHYTIPNDHTSAGWVNLSAGYHFEGKKDSYWGVNMPDSTQSGLLTINLDSITASNYTFTIHAIGRTFTLSKTTTGGTVSWTVTLGSDTRTLYYDQTRSDNTYQLYASITETEKSSDGIYQYFNDHYEFRYVGGWPSTFGNANSYQVYSFDKTGMDYVDPLTRTHYLNNFRFTSTSGYSPIVRVDAAQFGGIRYSVIESKVYDPASFKNNPSTEIKNITLYGRSITFAGHTYNVESDGNITLGTHKVSLDGIIFDSVPVDSGYENRINNIVISTTAQPSTIKFNGMWLISYIGTSELVANTYNHTEWIAGEFAWDGIDQNFLIVGMITSLAVFVGLGIYARKSNSRGVIPLMIVCGGAAVLFFVML